METKKIVVVGGGLVGSLLAFALRKKGHDITLLEKRPDFRSQTGDTGRSINLILTAKGIRPIVEWGLWDQVKPLLVPVSKRVMHSKLGELTHQPYGRNPSECNFSVSRSELNHRLFTLAIDAGVTPYFNVEIDGIDFEEQTIKVNGQEKIHFDLLLGTDGAGSQVRKLLHQTIPQAFSETIALGTDYKELTMPLNTNGKAAIDFNGLHIWPRGQHMLMALPNSDQTFTMTSFMTTELFKELDTKEKVEQFFQREYPDAVKLMPSYIQDFLDNPVGFLGTARVSHWSNHQNTALLGDSAHAIVPFFGQGMNSGFSDAWALVEELEKNSSIPETLKSYTNRQQPNGKAIADLSLQNFEEMRSRVGDERFLQLKSFEREIEKKYPELYRSRYSIVTYTLIDYSLAIEFGEQTLPLLERNLDSFLENTLDWELFEREIRLISGDWARQHNLSFERFPVPS